MNLALVKVVETQPDFYTTVRMAGQQLTGLGKSASQFCLMDACGDRRSRLGALWRVVVVVRRAQEPP